MNLVIKFPSFSLYHEISTCYYPMSALHKIEYMYLHTCTLFAYAPLVRIHPRKSPVKNNCEPLYVCTCKVALSCIPGIPISCKTEALFLSRKLARQTVDH